MAELEPQRYRKLSNEGHRETNLYIEKAKIYLDEGKEDAQHIEDPRKRAALKIFGSIAASLIVIARKL